MQTTFSPVQISLFLVMFNHNLCLALLIKKLAYAYIVESELLGFKPLDPMKHMVSKKTQN